MPTSRRIHIAPLLAAAWIASCSEYDSSLLHYSGDASLDAPPDASLDGGDAEPDSGDEAPADASEQDAAVDVETDGITEDVHEDVDPRSCDTCKDLTLLRPPCEHPGGTPGPGAGPLVFAVRTIRAAALPTDDIGAWRSLGYDLDCLLTMPDGKPGTCAAVAGAETLVEDGFEGRDNGFARNLSGQVRLLASYGVIPNLEMEAASRLESGKWGWTFVVDQYGGGDDDPQVKLTIYHSPGVVDSSGSPAQPAWNGQDRWAIESGSVDSSSLPLYVDPTAFVAGGTVVARLPGTVPFSLRGNSVRLDVPVQQLLVTLRLSSDRKKVEQGVIAGVIGAAEALGAFDDLAAQAGICLPNELYEGARAVIANSPDLRQQSPEPTGACDSLSFGIELTAEAAALGPVKPSQPVVVPPCPDAGL